MTSGRINDIRGKIGERILDRIMAHRGYRAYSPSGNGAHQLDRMYICANNRVVFADAKTYPARIHYPDTGINTPHFDKYRTIYENTGLQFWVFFIDAETSGHGISDQTGCVYGATIADLAKPAIINWRGKTLYYPIKEGGKTYFPCKHMQFVDYLSDAEISEIIDKTTRSSKYRYRSTEEQLPFDGARLRKKSAPACASCGLTSADYWTDEKTRITWAVRLQPGIGDQYICQRCEHESV